MKKKRKVRNDGVYRWKDLEDRCKLDEETGCLLWAQGNYRSSGCVWNPKAKRTTALTTMIGILKGKPLGPGQLWYATCGNCLCIKHRTIGTRSDQHKVLRPVLSPDHIAKFTATMRKNGKYDAEVKRQILESDETNEALGKRFGLHLTSVSKIRRGVMWKDAKAANSVFNWRPAA